MKSNDKNSERVDQTAEWEAIDPEMREALGNLRTSVHAWSENMVSRPRTAPEVVMHRKWRTAARWALSCVVFAGAVSGGVYENHRQQEAARIAAVREADHQRQLAAEHAREEEDLLAKVDSDISRNVPSAMEPLASLMTDDQTR
jgi:hypothetical protein